MDIRQVIQSQYGACLEMLRQAIEKCPAFLWNDRSYRNQFWHIAYHALFYTHLYLQSSAQDFIPWTRHREQYQFMGQLPWPPHEEPRIGEPYTRGDMLEYLAVCQKQVEEQVADLNLESESGFNWIPLNKLELQFYNIRHLQQHIGELCERLGTEKIDVDWVGRKPPPGQTEKT